MNMLARPGKASYQPLANATSEPASAPPQPQEQVAPAPTPSRAQTGPSLIGAGLSVVGRLQCAGDLQIEGSVEGEVRGLGVRVGNGAVVKGTVIGEIVQLAGTVEGNIEAETVVLAKTARLTGDISYQNLQIEQGAYFSGNGRPRRKEPAQPRRVLHSDAGSDGGYVTTTHSYSAPVPDGVD